MPIWMKITQMKSKESKEFTDEKHLEIQMKDTITWEKAGELAKTLKNSFDTFTKVELRQERNEEVKGEQV